MGAQKQKNALNCNFFAIGDCCGAPKRVSRRKSAANRLIGSQFVLCTDKRESAIAKKLHGRRIICFHNGKITITERILKRDADKRARIPLAGADGERTPASAATDIGRKCSGAVNGTRLAAQRAAATGGRQQWHRTYTSKSARALQVSMMTRKVRACASKSASGVLTSAGKLKSPWGWPNVPPPWALKFSCAVRTPRSVIAFRTKKRACRRQALKTSPYRQTRRYRLHRHNRRNPSMRLKASVLQERRLRALLWA